MKISLAIAVIFVTILSFLYYLNRAPKCKPLTVGQIISLPSGDQSVASISSDGLSARLSGGAEMACISKNTWTSNEPAPAMENQ